MRRKDREITDYNEICDIIKSGRVIHIAFADFPYPYVLPFNYGVDFSGNMPVIYIHGAYEGRKNRLISANPSIGFEISLCSEYQNGSITSFYRCVVGCGEITTVTDSAEKQAALALIMRQYNETQYRLGEQCVSRTNVLKIQVKEISGKKNG